jgi:hypothetical protein
VRGIAVVAVTVILIVVLFADQIRLILLNLWG